MNAHLRCLVVDDDEGVREFLLAILAREGIRADACADGRDAAHRLRSERWDLVFLDLLLPLVGGDVLLRLMHDGDMPRPRWLAVMGATRPLAGVDGEPWMRGATFLPKPFLAADVRALLDQAAGRRDPAVVREVLIAGCGLWSDALARVVSRRGGRAVLARDADELSTRLRESKPAAVVLGPPLSDAELVCALVDVREASDSAPLLAALKATSRARADLLSIGAFATFSMPSELPALGALLMKIAGLRRVHRRAPLLAPVLCRTGRVLHAAVAFDLGEGGLGLEAVSREHGLGIAEVEFTLPGGATIVAAAEVAWLGEGNQRRRVGVRFTDVDEDSVARIREHVRGMQREAFAMSEPY